jgi:ectoine hydroxylase-related dioxygenase (phytanoyl-CoA dioxygenase family)
MFLHFKEKINDSDELGKKIGLYPGDAVMFDGDVIHAGDGWTHAARERVFLYVATNNNGRPKVPKIQVRDKNGDKNSQMVSGTHF